MKRGTLFYDKESDRIDVAFRDEKTYGGLHCGEVFEALTKGKYQTVRIEFGSGWYLITDNGRINQKEMIGMRVRI